MNDSGELPITRQRVPLLDIIEEKFAYDEFLKRVREMDKRAKKSTCIMKAVS